MTFFDFLFTPRQYPMTFAQWLALVAFGIACIYAGDWIERYRYRLPRGHRWRLPWP